MKRFAIITLSTLLAVLVAGEGVAWAGWGCTYGGYQPWWNIFCKKNKCLTPEEERLQRFWHDYYDALGRYYKALDHIDWVAYYKNHGYMINGGCGGYGQCGGPRSIQFAPVFVSPSMQWAIPNQGCGGCLPGAPYGPSFAMHP